MTVTHRVPLLVAILSSVLFLPGKAAGQDTQLISYRENSPVTGANDSTRPSWLKLPTLKAPTTTVAMPNLSQSFEKLGKNTQRLMRRTKQALTPPKTPNLRLPTLKRPKQTKDRLTKRPALFGSLFKRKPPEPQQPKTLNDWLALPKP